MCNILFTLFMTLSRLNAVLYYNSLHYNSTCMYMQKHVFVPHEQNKNVSTHLPYQFAML